MMGPINSLVARELDSERIRAARRQATIPLATPALAVRRPGRAGASLVRLPARLRSSL